MTIFVKLTSLKAGIDSELDGRKKKPTK